MAWGSGQSDANAAFSQRLSELALARSEVEIVLGADQAQKIAAVETCMRKLAFAFGQYFYQAELYTSVIGHPELKVNAVVRESGYKQPFNRERAIERIKCAASVLQSFDRSELEKDEDPFGKELDSAVRNAQESLLEVLRLQR